MLKNIFTAVIVKQNLSLKNAMSLIGSRDLFHCKSEFVHLIWRRSSWR